MNQFQHIEDNLHLLCKYKKIIVLKTPDKCYYGNGKMFYSMAKKYYNKRDLSQEKCVIDTFQTGFWDMIFDLIIFTTNFV